MIPAGLLIRPCRPEDRPALVEQFLALNRYEEPLARNRRTDLAGAEESLDAALERVERTGGAALIAEWRGAVAGHLFLTFEEDAAYVRAVRAALRPYAYISELFVREEARRRGIGRALLAEAERLAAARGVPRLMIGVLAGNAEAAALYRRFGFRDYAVEMRKAVPSGDDPAPPVSLPTER
ncbi:L-amino acid N-acyltransferase YncA [Roseomonas rosea]|uniref:L-amino acid N-acyltransferase YncA n=1 Tax=Muricoccus roseus TaxID=198092 RepID=A0A1M6D008_9PROT|nr:GNAT family N-acetyltransferase [Roseomonas rosea]SHI66612.1 L-amino acid N-acyltransferase YncA [Roseomonas rosea]